MIVDANASISRAHKIYNSNKFSTPTKYRLMTYEFYKSKYYFLASIFAKEFLRRTKKVDDKFLKVFGRLIIKSGSEIFIDLEYDVLNKFKRFKQISFILGIKYFRDQEYKGAYRALQYIPKKSPFYPEANLTQGTILDLLGYHKRSIYKYTACQKAAKKLQDNASHPKQQRYYMIINETCTIHVARSFYKKKNYEKALEMYDQITKESYLWPTILLEKAWSNYYLENYNRSLGLLVTYKSPLLKSYFFPEGEVLTALSYLKLCLWDDAYYVIKQYYKVYSARSIHLKKILQKHETSKSFYYKLVFAPLEYNEKQNPFVRNLVTQIRKKIKFGLDYTYLKRAKNELKHLKRFKKTKLIKFATQLLTGLVKFQSESINHFAQKSMFNFINDIHTYSYEMFSIYLDIIARKRTLLYENKNLVSDRSRGSLEEVNIRTSHDFWNFEGAFWADELGEYSFGLKSNCETAK